MLRVALGAPTTALTAAASIATAHAVSAAVVRGAAVDTRVAGAAT